jgi:hypothetical protein
LPACISPLTQALVATIDDDNRYSQLESILVQIQVKELITSSKPNDRLKDTLSRCSTLITIIHKNKFEIPSSDNSIFAKGCGTENENHLQCISGKVLYLAKNSIRLFEGLVFDKKYQLSSV